MMSSRYTSEQLTNQLIKALLKILADQIRPTVSFAYEQALKTLPSHLRQELRRRGDLPEFKRILYYTYRKGYVNKISGKGDAAVVAITKSGRKRLETLDFELLELKRGQKWDRKWRVLIFDIPESKRAARAQIRRLIKELGFKPLQRSVWIHPLPCAKEVKAIQDAYGVHADIMLLEVNHFDKEEEFRRAFRFTVI